MSDLRIRRADNQDAQAVAGLMRFLGFDPSAGEIERRFELVSDHGLDSAYLAETIGKPIGLLAVHIAPLLFYPRPLARITTLVVAVDERRRGVGRRLVAFARQLADEAGCDKLELTTGLSRVEAHAFYEAVGFRHSALHMSLTVG
jgi:GNAT superfamily N-acetyltransferase